MTEPVLGLLYQYDPHPTDLAVLWREMETRVIPLARELGVIPAHEGRDQLCRSALQRLSQLVGDVPQDPREAAAHNIYNIAAELQFAARLLKVEAEHGEASAELDGDWPDATDLMHLAAVMIPHVFGYLSALRDSRRATSRRGTNGRRLIGATTRDRARKAAEQFRGRMSRAAAAPQIARLIGKEPGTVLRMLSELFPGDQWAGSNSDEPKDASR